MSNKPEWKVGDRTVVEFTNPEESLVVSVSCDLDGDGSGTIVLVEYPDHNIAVVECVGVCPYRWKIVTD